MRFGAKKQKEFNDKFKNKSIIIIALMVSVSVVIAGLLGLKAEQFPVFTILIILLFLIGKFAHGMFYTIMDRYFRNFTNDKIDTKIFAVKNMFTNICSAFMGMMAAFLLDKMSTAYAMIVVGITFTFIFILMEKYMKTRVGLKPEQYSKVERKYDEIV